MRESNFKIDSEKYGKFGEDLFRQQFELYHTGDATLQDVTEDAAWQSLDVDFLVYKKVGYQTIVTPIEVKVDTTIVGTGNIALEIQSHGKPGWLMKTGAAWIMIYACKDGEQLEHMGTFALNTKFKEVCNHIKHIQHATISRIEKENIVDLLYPIDYLISTGYLKRIRYGNR